MTEKEKKFWKGAVIVSTEMLAGMYVFTGILAGLIFLIRPGMRQYKKTDLKILDMIEPHRNERNTRIMSFFTMLAAHEFLIPANLSLIINFLFIRRRSWLSIRIASITLSSPGLMFWLKHLFKRKRPFGPLQKAKGLSFPSGHAIMSSTFYGLLIYITSKTVQDKPLKWLMIISFVILIQLIGFSRVYLRAHYASDVAVGYIVGVCWLLISLEVLKKIEVYNEQKLALLPGLL
ncbi:MAG: phosphatase PAP2 family protein [Ginsengibacter sp.]